MQANGQERRGDIVKQRVNHFLLRVANALTLTRLLAVPLVIYLLLATRAQPSANWAALGLIVGLQISDILDGYLARQAQGERRQNPTGEILDPIADKLYINGAYLTLMVIDRVPGWAAGVIVARDALIIVGWLLRYLRSGVRMLPNVLGKMADSSQAMFLIVLLAGPPEPVVEVFLWLAVCLTAASGLAYARVALEAPQEA